jgi:hypothetical protein
VIRDTESAILVIVALVVTIVLTPLLFQLILAVLP